MPPKQPVVVQSWSTKRNDEELALTRSKFPPAIAPDKQKQKLFIDAFAQTCAQLQISVLPCFENLIQHPGTELAQVTVHSAIIDVASSLAIGHALSECTDTQSVIFCDCIFSKAVLGNMLHFLHRTAPSTLVFDKIEFENDIFDFLLQCLAINKCSVKFIDCEFDYARLIDFLGSGLCDMCYLSIINCKNSGASGFEKNYSNLILLKGIEIFGIDLDGEFFNRKLPILVAARQMLIRGLFTEELAKLYTADYAKSHQKYAEFASNYGQLIRSNEQKWNYEADIECIINYSVYQEFLDNVFTPDEMLVEYISMNNVFDEFTGTETQARAFRRLEYIGGDKKYPASPGILFWDGESAALDNPNSEQAD